MRLSGHYAVFNKHGHIGEIRGNLIDARMARATRGDAVECVVKSITIEVGDTIPDEVPKKRPKK